VQLCVIAKEPVPGRVKTRLCPPCTPDQAAAVAVASLADTLAVVRRVPAARRVLVLDGRTGPWLPPGFDVVAQAGGGLGDRLAHAFAVCFAARPCEAVVLIGMDTPQVRAEQLIAAADRLDADADAVIGLATDGGYWLIGLARPVPGAFAGVPMSTARTGAAQRARLHRLGCRTAMVERLTDVDDAVTAVEVARSVPGSRFAAVVDDVLSPSGRGADPARPGGCR
jgi:rSAM/selenodomain-associated transferase 1